MSNVAAFDGLEGIVTTRETSPLQLRFAYVHLISVINAIKEEAARGRLGGLCRKVGYSDASVAIDAYLTSKGTPSDIRLRRRLCALARTGRRWCELAGPSPFCLSVYSRTADNVV